MSSVEQRQNNSDEMGAMFDHIAPTYQRVNTIMTFGLDAWWRDRLIKRLRRRKPVDVLDVACGTGDLMMLMAKKIPTVQTIEGIDLSVGMLQVAKQDAQQFGCNNVCLHFAEGNALALNQANSSFDAVTCAFGIRNFPDRLQALREMHRVLRPGGVAMILELSVPRSRLLHPFYHFYTRRIIPIIGRRMAADEESYTYLPESIEQMPSRQQMVAIMREAGFAQASCKDLMPGVCNLFTAVKE